MRGRVQFQHSSQTDTPAGPDDRARSGRSLRLQRIRSSKESPKDSQPPRTDRIRVGAVAGRWVEQVWAPQQIVERQVGDEWGAGESKQPRRGVQIVLFGFTSGEFAQRAAARRNLARKQRRRNRTVKEATAAANRSEEHTSELQSQSNLVCRLLLEKKKKRNNYPKSRLWLESS